MAETAKVDIVISAKDQASSVFKGIGDSLKLAGKAAAAPARALGGVTDALGKVGLASVGIQAVTGAAQGLGSAVGVGLASEMEQTRASFMAFTKDAGKTEQILGDIRAEASRTPFTFQEMARAAASLQPATRQSGEALMDLMKTAEVLAASNPLEGLEGASFSLREAISGDFTSIVERFNLSRSTLNELKAQGVPAMEAVRIAMAELGLDSDLIAAKAETLEGRWSTFTDTVDTLKLKMATPIFDAMKEGLTGLQGLLDENAGAIEGFADSMADGIKESIKFGKELGAAVLPAIQEIGPEVMKMGRLFKSGFEIVAEAVQTAIQGDLRGAFDLLTHELAEVGGAILEQVGEWARAFLDWIGPIIPPLLKQLGELASEMVGWAVTVALPGLVETLAGWAAAFIDWVGPMIMPMLRELGKLLEKLATWVSETGLPLLLKKLSEWGEAFVEWVKPRIGPMLQELGSLLADMVKWMVGTALPAIIGKLAEWGLAFIEWIAKDVLPHLPDALAAVASMIGGWIADTAGSIGSWAVQLGAQLISGFLSGLASLGAQLTSSISAAIRGIRIDIGPFHLSADGFRIDSPPPVTLTTVQRTVQQTVSGGGSPGESGPGGIFNNPATGQPYAHGGIVPGPRGAPSLGILHGGEMVLPVDFFDGRARAGGLPDAGGGLWAVVQLLEKAINRPIVLTIDGREFASAAAPYLDNRIVLRAL